MKKTLTFTAILAFALIAGVGKVEAQPVDNTPTLFDSQPTIERILNLEPPKQKDKPKEKKITYKVKQGDSLNKIAKKYKTNWKRLYYKNKHIASPDNIKVGQVLTIPKASEKLKSRSIQVQAQTAVVEPQNRLNGSTAQGHGNFEYGWCTWYAQNQRPDRRFSGNAADWIVYANSRVPRVGSVAVNTYVAGGYGHVAIVRAVKGNQVFVEEMNYEGFGVISSRWTDKSEWQGYIL